MDRFLAPCSRRPSAAQTPWIQALSDAAFAHCLTGDATRANRLHHRIFVAATRIGVRTAGVNGTASSRTRV